MCGIFGLIKAPKDSVFPEEITAPLRVLAHRGPDGRGTFFQRNVGLGHNRLSIFDLSDAGAQPMTRGSSTIIFNGAIYNFLEIRSLLEKTGYSFQSQSDTEVILAAYDHWGEDCVNRFNGQWAFAIYDEKRQRIFCSRDRFGIKPFYYSWIDGKFCFASEIKAFITVKGWQARLNRARAYEYLVYGYHDHTSETLFADVHQLPKGHHLIFDLQQHHFNIRRYYGLDSIATTSLSYSEATAQFKSLFEDAIRIRLRSDVAVGSALSGGLDSSSIVATINKVLKKENKPQPQQTISACFPGFIKDETKWIDSLTAKYSLKAQKVYPSSTEFFDQVKKLTWTQDEPLAGASIFAQYKVFEAARSVNIPVMLDGQGADEILAGYDKFYLPYFKQLAQKSPWRLPIEAYHYFKKHKITIPTALKAIQRFQSKPRQQDPTWLHPEFTITENERFVRLPDRTITQTSLNLFTEMGLSALLHYEDRNAMAWGVESRLPFLDHRLVEFCLSLPDDYKIYKGYRKRILRVAMADRLTDSILNRYDKIGFSAPQEAWMDEYSSTIEKKLKSTQQKLDRIFNDTTTDLQSKALQWRIWSFGVWMEEFEVDV